VKRQIIKTKPVQPYRIARIVIVVALLVIVFGVVYFVLGQRGRATHAAAAPRTTVRQDLTIFSRNPQSPAILT
jgi:hypothetical protein